MKDKKIVIIGGGVAGACAVTELVDNGYPGELITIIDKGKDPYNRKPEEVMEGWLGCGGFSDGKLTYHTSIGGQLSKYCGEEKAYKLFDKVIANFKRFHPKPKVIMKSDPQSEPDFIKPYFGLRLFPVYHIGSDYLHELGKKWYDYLLSKNVIFKWETSVQDIYFNSKHGILTQESETGSFSQSFSYDKLIFAVGKSGIDFSQKLINEYNLPTEIKSVQIGVRFEAPQKYFQKLIDISYDFKLYRRVDNVSLRSFCTNNVCAYVAVENTYGDVSYNGHALRNEKYKNEMTNFGILMEIKGIENPFEWSRDVVSKLQKNGTGVYYSPNNTRQPSLTSENAVVSTAVIDSLAPISQALGHKYTKYIVDFIQDMQRVFPEMENDWGIYLPEIKYASPEPIVNYSDLSLTLFPNVYFVGDALSARGITCSGGQAIYVAESILKNE